MQFCLMINFLKKPKIWSGVCWFHCQRIGLINIDHFLSENDDQEQGEAAEGPKLGAKYPNNHSSRFSDGKS